MHPHTSTYSSTPLVSKAYDTTPEDAVHRYYYKMYISGKNVKLCAKGVTQDSLYVINGLYSEYTVIVQ